MSVLLDLVGRNHLRAHQPADPGDSLLAAGKKADARAGERDLRGRAEQDHARRVASLLRGPEQIRVRGRRIDEVVHGIGIIGEDGEVGRRGLHSAQAIGHRLRGCVAGRVAVGRDVEQALHARIGRHQLFDGRDVRPVRVHAYGDHGDAQPLQHQKVPVVAGHSHDEFHVAPAPGRRASRYAPQHGPHEHIAFEGQAGVVAHDDFVGLYTQHGREELAGLLDAGDAAGIVTQGHTARRDQRLVVHDGQHGVRDIEVVVARLPAGQIELETEGAQGIVAFACCAHGYLHLPHRARKIQFGTCPSTATTCP